MSRVDNLNSGELKDILRRLRALETAAPMNNGAVGRSGFEVYDGGTVDFTNGTLRVNGLASITGTFQVSGGSTFTGQVAISGPLTISGNTAVSGQFTVTGPTKLNGQTDIGGNTSVTGDLDVKGPLTVTGITKLNGKTDIGGNTAVTGDLDVKGPLDVTGTMDIKGKSTLQNDLEVKGGGKIKVGANMTLNPATGGGRVEFTNGAAISSSGTDLKMNATGAGLSLGTQAVVTGGTSSMVMAGSSTSLNTPLAIISARMQARGIRQAPAGVESNLRWDPASGEIMYIP